MSKYLYPAPGQLVLNCRVSSKKGKKMFSTIETGTSSMMNVFQSYKSKIEGAKINAIYKHVHRGGGSDAIVEIIDYDINYFDNLVTRKRVERTNKRGKKKLYSISISKETGKQTGRAHIWRKADI